MPRSKREVGVDDLAIARLHVQGCTQKETCERLKIPVYEVCKSLKRTDGRYWKPASPVAMHALSHVPADLELLVAARISGGKHPSMKPARLMALAGAPAQLQHLKSVTVVPAECVLGPDADANDWAQWMKVFGRLAAVVLRPLSMRGSAWGVTWGSHLAAVVDALTTDNDGSSVRQRELDVVALCGNRWGDVLVRECSSAIAEQLGRELSLSVTAPGALHMVPAFIDGSFSRDEALTIWKHIARSGYSRIFGGRIPEAACAQSEPGPAWVDRLDAIVTSVSRDGRPFGFGVGTMYENAGFDGALIDRIYLGDIGGVGLVRPGAAPLPLLEERWTGLRRDELLACARKAAADGSDAPGVVVVASEAARANSLLEAVRLGYVSHAIIDESLNNELAAREIRARSSAAPCRAAFA